MEDAAEVAIVDDAPTGRGPLQQPRRIAVPRGDGDGERRSLEWDERQPGGSDLDGVNPNNRGCARDFAAEDEDSGSHGTESQLEREIHRLSPPNKKGRQHVKCAGGPASKADAPAVAPWLCVAAFRRFCSEQQRRTWENRRVPVVTGVTSVRRRL